MISFNSSFLFKPIFIFLLFYGINAQGQKKVIADTVFAYICEKNIAHPEIVIKQAILETGWFKSPFLMSRNNLFGFRKNSYLRFNNWKESVDYYKKWQEKRYVDPSENYYAFLIRIKFAVAGYTDHLKKIKYNNSCN